MMENEYNIRYPIMQRVFVNWEAFNPDIILVLILALIPVIITENWYIMSNMLLFGDIDGLGTISVFTWGCLEYSKMFDEYMPEYNTWYDDWD